VSVLCDAGFTKFQCRFGHLPIKARVASTLFRVDTFGNIKFLTNNEKAIAAFNDMLTVDYHE
jgi:hypothetical protein